MKDSPIPFCGPMVTGVLEERKNKTRRLVNPQPNDVGFGRNCSVAPYCTGTAWPLAYYERRGACWNSSNPLKCPYGKAGDHLWVREAWRTAMQWDHLSPAELPIDNFITAVQHIDYLADAGKKTQHGRYRHARFMPRWASRTDLEITDIRIERLHDITVEDAIAEGIERAPEMPGGNFWKNYLFKTSHPKRRDTVVPECREILGYMDPISSFASLWDSINGIGSYAAANPRVWVISFKLI